MMRTVLGVRHSVSAITCLIVALGVWSDSCAGDIDEAEQLFADHCAVCHGADRGGYIGPALNRDETMLTEFEIYAKITTGGVGTLMPQHPTWRGTLSRKEIDQLVSLVAQQPKRQVSWRLDDIRHSLEVYVADESSLPATPTYPIENLDDLMVVTARGSYSAGDDAKVMFFDGRTNDKLGEIATGFAPHIVDFHPTEERWAYVRTDVGDVLKVDLYSLQVVRKVRAGLNGVSLAVSRDGRYVAAGSFVPNTAVILDAATLLPLKERRHPSFLQIRKPAFEGQDFPGAFVLSTRYHRHQGRCRLYLLYLPAAGRCYVDRKSDSRLQKEIKRSLLRVVGGNTA